MPPYDTDLAYIHDSGFGSVAQNAADAVLRLLGRSQKSRSANKLVVDLGCGSGILAKTVSAAGYDVVGFDLSEAMLALAARRAPRAEFRCESFVSAELPRCIAVTAIGEIFNYLFDRRNTGQQLVRVFRRIYEALEPGGLFLFDVAEPGRVPNPGALSRYSEGPGWACLYSAEEDRRRKTLTRTITTFRQAGDLYRRTREVHCLRLYPQSVVVGSLRSVGFPVRILRGYEQFRFPRGWTGFVARKPLR